MGTLGLITDVSLKVLPQAPAEVTLACPLPQQAAQWTKQPRLNSPLQVAAEYSKKQEKRRSLHSSSLLSSHTKHLLSPVLVWKPAKLPQRGGK
jgi:FAD/FMN-containing dehydrogenase